MSSPYTGASTSSSNTHSLRSSLLRNPSTANSTRESVGASAFEFNDEALNAEGDAPVERRVEVFNVCDETAGGRQEFARNSIITSRYTWYSYLPKTLFEQFRRLANVYFVVIGIIAVVGILLPMTIVVLISVVKDGIEDVKRHRTDVAIDALPARVVQPDGSVAVVRWSDLTVGSVVLLLCDDAVPADITLVACGGIQGPTAYVETAAIDGESNLKIKLPCYHPSAYAKSRDEGATSYAGMTSSGNGTTAANPTPTTSSPRSAGGGIGHSTSSASSDSGNGADVSPSSDYVPPGVREYMDGVIGSAVTSGGDDRDVRMSMRRLPSSGNLLEADDDTSSSGQLLNDPHLHIVVSTDKTKVHGAGLMKGALLRTDAPTEFINAFNGSIQFHPDGVNTQAITSTVSSAPVALSSSNLLLRGSVVRATEWCVGIVTYTGMETKVALNSKRVPSKLSSLDRVVNHTLVIAIAAMVIVCVASSLLGMLWDSQHDSSTYLCLDEDDRAGCESGSTNSTGLSVFTFATLYNNFVCISMYVSLEMIYLGQAYFIQNDLELYDETTDTPAEVHSSGLLADLGQVQYVLSDKTGTITKNVMRVRRCSVGGEVFGSPMMGHTASSSSSSSNNNNSGSGGGGALFRGIEDMRIAKQRITSSNSSSTAATDERSASAQLMQDFLCIMAACNTVMLMPDSLTGELHVSDEASLEKCLQAESADEVALVLAAAKFGDALLVHRDVRSIVVKGLGNSTGTTASSSSRDSATHTSGKDREGGNSATTTTYDVVAVNTFDSDRKRMSVLIKPRQNGGISSSSGGDANRGPSKKDGDCILLCKGADNSMLPLCNPSAHTAACMAHIEEFANSGLRTLVFGMKRVSSRDANLWLQQHNAAANSLVNRTALLARAASDIESGLDLVGAVGIEDELQDGVPEAISQLQRMGLNVWMITGDKVETAIAISKICGLIKAGTSDVQRVSNLKGAKLRARLAELHDYIGSQYMTLEEEQLLVDASYTSIDDGSRPILAGIARGVARLLKMCSGSDSSGHQRDTDSRSIAMPLRGISAGNPAADEPNTPSVGLANNSPRPAKRPRRDLVLVVDGYSLESICSDDATKKDFQALISRIPTVVAARVSPLQKAILVNLVKNSSVPAHDSDTTASSSSSSAWSCWLCGVVAFITGSGNKNSRRPVTLALGDGANDIGMIHEARVGVGISGREGKHAANSADFAIGQFRFIVPLLLVYGRYIYLRSSKLVLYSFFKNLVLVSTLFYFCIYSGFSGTMYLDSIVFSGFNFYLGMPIVILGIFDKDVPVELVYKYPKLAYQSGRRNELMSMGNFFRWCLSAFVYGAILFAMVSRVVTGHSRSYDNGSTLTSSSGSAGGGEYSSVGDVKDPLSGHDGGLYVAGFYLFTTIVLCMQVVVARLTNYWTWIHHLWIALSIAGYLLFAIVFSQFEEVYDWYKVVDFALSTRTLYLGIIVVVVLMTFVDAVLAQLSSAFFPSSESRMKEIERLYRRQGVNRPLPEALHPNVKETGRRAPDSGRESSSSEAVVLQRRRTNSDEDYIAPPEDTLATGGSRVIGGETLRVISTDDLVYDDAIETDGPYTSNDSADAEHRRRGDRESLLIPRPGRQSSQARNSESSVRISVIV